VAAAPTKWTDERLDDAADRLTRFEANVDKRFEHVDARFDKLESKIDKILWLLIGGFVTILAAIATKLLLG
jgi:hypothetical protein